MAYSRREHGGITHHFSFALLKTPKIQHTFGLKFSVCVLDFPLTLPYNNAGYKKQHLHAHPMVAERGAFLCEALRFEKEGFFYGSFI